MSTAAIKLPHSWRSAKSVLGRVAHDPGLIASLDCVRNPSVSAWDLGEPWWNSRAIRYARRQLRAGDMVFEWGSGGSTVWLTSLGARVTAIESAAEWAEKVNARCPGAPVRLIPGEDTGELRSEPEGRDQGQHFFDRYVSAIDEFPDDTFDMIIVDGICRAECARRAARKVRPGGLVVVDDTHRGYLDPCSEPFQGWGRTRLRGFKRGSGTGVLQTTFFRRPVGPRGTSDLAFRG